MKILKNMILALVFLLIAGQLNSQTIRLVRTDVDTTRSSFVTATYLFGIDIVVDSVQRTNGVTFELAYNMADKVKYSEHQSKGFGENSTTVVIPDINEVTGEGRIYVGVSSGLSIDSAKLEEPTVVHLDFAVSQTALNNQQVTFTFRSAYAVVYDDTLQSGVIVNLESVPTIYAIHGYVNVWPGDADNNGAVDNRDLNQIILYLGSGSKTKYMRSFKRENASTFWTAQRVLAWDSSLVSFADCDGNSEITVADMLVVPLNFKKTHSIFEKTGGNSNEVLSETKLWSEPEESYTDLIPIYVRSNKDYVAAKSSISWNNFPSEIKVVGFLGGDLFSRSESFFYYNVDESEKSADIVFGRSENNIWGNKEGMLYYMAIERPAGVAMPDAPIAQAAQGMSPYGYIFNMDIVSDVEDLNENNSEIFIQVQSDQLIIEDNSKSDFHSDIKIFDVNGKILLQETKSTQKMEISIGHLSTGVYFVNLSSRQKNQTSRFIIHR
jgi:Secretion system C-terminal sorting domain